MSPPGSHASGAALPARTAVTVIGHGLSALALADELSLSDHDLIVLSRRGKPQRASPSLGAARVGPVMHLARLAAGHGEARAAACVHAGLANRTLLAQRAAECGVRIERRGSLRFATGPDEAEEMQRSVQLLERLDRPAAFDDVRAFVDDAPPRFTHAALHEDDCVVDVDALHDALERRLAARGVEIFRDVRVLELEDDREVRIESSRGTLQTEVVIVADEEFLAARIPFCRFKVVPMRTQALSAVAPAQTPGAAVQASAADGSPGTSTALPPLWSAVHGYETWVHERRALDRVHVSGSRKLPVKRELGPRTGTTPEVQTLLENNLHDFQSLRTHAVERRWSALQGMPCDGLPLVGAIPGRARVLVCGGFGVNDVGWAFVAARTLAELLQDGRAEHEKVLSPRRFL